MLHVRGLWTAMKEGAIDEVEDHMAMEALLRGVPSEMASMLGSDRARMSLSHPSGACQGCVGSAQVILTRFRSCPHVISTAHMQAIREHLLQLR
jgi:hypothetical protein